MSPACVGFFRVSDGRYHRMRTEFLVHDVSADTRPSDADLTLRRHLWEKSRLRGARGSSSGVCSSHEASSVSQHGSRTWLLSAAEGHAKRRYDLSRPTFFFEFFRMTIKVTEFVQFLNSIVLQCFEAADERSTTPCASAVAPTPRDPQCSGLSESLSLVPAFQHGAAPWPVALGCGRRALGTDPTPQSCDRVGKLRGRIRDLGGRQMHRHRSRPATLPRARAWFRLQSAPAATLADQPHCPDSSRVVCHSRSGPVRTGSPPSRQDRRSRVNEAWNAALRCAPGAARNLLSEAIIVA